MTLSETDIAKARAMRGNGASYQKIADELHVSKSTIFSLLNKQNGGETPARATKEVVRFRSERSEKTPNGTITSDDLKKLSVEELLDTVMPLKTLMEETMAMPPDAMPLDRKVWMMSTLGKVRASIWTNVSAIAFKDNSVDMKDSPIAQLLKKMEEASQ